MVVVESVFTAHGKKAGYTWSYIWNAYFWVYSTRQGYTSPHLQRRKNYIKRLPKILKTKFWYLGWFDRIKRPSDTIHNDGFSLLNSFWVYVWPIDFEFSCNLQAFDSQRAEVDLNQGWKSWNYIYIKLGIFEVWNGHKLKC